MAESKTNLKVKSLKDVKPGSMVYYSHIDAGKNAKARMVSMGLRKGTPFKLARSSRNGPFVISLSGNRMVLGRGVTDKIMVTEEEPETASPQRKR